VRYLLAAVLLGLGLTAAGCGGEKSAATTAAAPTTRPVTTTKTTVSGRYHYPPSVIASFMQTCTQGDPARQRRCACVIDKLSNTVSNRDLVRIARVRKASPRVERAIVRARTACA
jgi:hypothetical protein